MREKVIESNNLYGFGPFLINETERRLLRDDVPVKLGDKAFDLLLDLVKASGHTRTREELMRDLWPDSVVEEQGLTVAISGLRKALGDNGHSPRYVATVHRHGYRFIAPVTIKTTEAVQVQVQGSGVFRKRSSFIAVSGLVAVIATGFGIVWYMGTNPRPPTPRAVRLQAQDPQAYNLFLKATYLTNQVLDPNNAEAPAAAAARAEKLYRKVVARDPRFALAWARLSQLESFVSWHGLLNATSRRMQQAERAARRALALAPDLAEAHLAMGYVDYHGYRDYGAALKEFTRAKQGLPDQPRILEAIAYIHRRQGNWKAALSELRRAATLGPHNPRWPSDIGVTLVDLRRYEQAEAAFARALAIQPHSYNAMVYSVWALLRAGKFSTARETLKTLPDTIDSQELVFGMKFEVAWLGRNADRALAILKNAPPWIPTPTTTTRGVPKCLLQAEVWALLQGNDKLALAAYKKARGVLQEALRAQPDNPDLWSALGLAEAGLGQKTAAIRDGLHAAELRPVSNDAVAGPFYLATLARIYAHTGDSSQALSLLRKLFEMPAGAVISSPLVKIDPAWDPIRRYPEFNALLAHYSQPPADASAVAKAAAPAPSSPN
ncbi:MAG TPA: tetratricopeptide repeat protein [Gammaproteobacteria bacterium]|nr:tetratricopeptide repeat protein [Gammaproteobacteria bacterium]